MKRHTIACCLIITTALLAMSGCSGEHFSPDTISDANPWTHLEMNNDPDNFQFVIVADRTGKHRPPVFADAVEKTNHIQPEFVICVGDQVQGNEEDADVLIAQWDEFDAIVEKLEMLFFMSLETTI